MVDLINKKIGRLIVLRKDEENTSDNNWVCLCMCGNECTVKESDLINKTQTTCGHCKNRGYNFRHGDARRGGHHKLYGIRKGMIERCYNPNSIAFPRYGGRGIKICKEWLENYNNFKTWAINSGYQEGLSIDRIDSDGDYTPENCRWANDVEQANNKKCVEKYEYDGETHSIPEWARILGVKRELLRDRIHRLGWSVDEALSTPPKPINNLIEYNGQSHTIKEWSEITKIPENTLRSRKHYMESIEKIFTTPYNPKH